MIASIVLNTEYMTDEERIKWFLKNVSFARHEKCVIITHEIIKKKLTELVTDCQERFYEEFEMEHVTVEEIESMDICYLPDSIFDDIYQKCGSRTNAILNLLYERNAQIEDMIIKFIDGCLKKHSSDKLDFILNSLHTPISIKEVSKHYSAPIIPYVFSCIRKVHGYQQTLYMAHIDNDLFISDEAKKLYESYFPKSLDYKPLSKKEILALLGKKHNLVLLPLLKRQGINDFGVCGGGYHIIPNTYREAHITDDDLHFEIKRVMPKARVISRLHPIQMDQAGFGRKHMKNDPAAFCLSCRRVTTVQSQMIVKAAMWNRVPCVLGDGLPFNFLFEKNFMSENVISDEDLNFLLFAYFVPNSCMFNIKYWEWRLSNPSANQLYKYHLEVIFDELGVAKENINDKNRVELILKNRGCTDKEISKILGEYSSKDINYNYLSSKATLDGEQRKDLFTLNQFQDNTIVTTFEIENANTFNRVKINLPNDLDGFITIIKCTIDGIEMDINKQRKYWKKGAYEIEFPFWTKSENAVIQIEWIAENYFEAFE